jgi:CHAT domain-containing protein/Tfp pilus assembly protein PilF
MQNNFWLICLLLFQNIVTANFSIAQNSVTSLSDFPDSLQDELMDLKWSEKEVRNIARILPGKIFISQDASERNFKQYARDANIIHLATHALIDDNAPLYSRFLFSTANDTIEDGLLHTHELYNMHLNASLAVLSACNTGAGKLVSGEGIMSLARGFMYANCPNVLVSLWPVDDKATAEIMQLFYAGLKRGLNKDNALREAKLTYLKNADEVKSNPFYWANFILIGDANPIHFKQNSNFMVLGLIALVLIFSLVIVFRYKLFSGKKKNAIIALVVLLPIAILLCHSLKFRSLAQSRKDSADSLFIFGKDDFAKAQLFQQRAQFDSSISYFQKVGAKHEADQNWEEYFKCLINISENFRQKQDYNQALSYLSQAKKIGFTHLMHQPALTAQLDNSYGNVFRKMGNLDSSYHYFKSALNILRKQAQPDSIELANSYHGIGVMKYYQGDYESSFTYHQQALTIRLKKLGKHHPLVADSYVNLGIVANSKGDFEKSLNYHQQGLELRKAILGADHPDMANSYLNLGASYNETGDYDRSLPYFEKAVDITTKTIGAKSPFVAGCYLNIGLVYDRKGDYEKALEYYNKSLSLILETSGEDHPLVAEIYNNMGIVYKKKADYTTALQFYHRTLGMNLARFGEHHPNVIKSYMNIANVHSLEHDFETAIEFYKKSLSIAHQIYNDDSPLVAYLHHNIGAAKSAHGNFEEAQHEFNKALLIGIKIFGEKHPFISEIYFELGENSTNQENFEQALHCYQQAIIALVSDFENQNIYSNPPLKNISEEIRLLSIFAKKAATLEALYSQKTKDIKDLTFSLLTYDLAIQLVDKISRGYKAEASRLFLRENAHDVYCQAIDVAYDLYQLTHNEEFKHKAFLFAEKSKARVLQQALLDSKAKKFGGIPDSLLEQEYQLKNELALYDKKIFKEREQGSAGDSIKIRFWQDRIFGLNRNYESLMARFETEYPEYYKLKYQAPVVSPWLLQKKIAEENFTVLEYFVTDNSVITFILTKNSFDMIASSKDSLFENRIKTMLSALKSSDYFGYASKASLIYQLLIAPIESQISTQQLIIIPDGLLGYLPFESLLTEDVSDNQQDYRTLPYLIHKYQINYHCSASLLYEALTHRQEQQGRINFVGFAPVKF